MALRRCGFLCLVLVFFGACSDPDSRDNLAAVLDRIPIPAAASEVRETYEECPDEDTRSVCPMLVRWYRIDVGTDGDYTFFVTFNGGRGSSEDQVPAEVDLEVSVGPVPSFE